MLLGLTKGSLLYVPRMPVDCGALSQTQNLNDIPLYGDSLEIHNVSVAAHFCALIQTVLMDGAPELLRVYLDVVTRLGVL
jgi:hypothetical protein